MTDTHRRRSFLAGAGAVAVTLAGCASLPGGDGGGGGDEATDADGNEPTDSGEPETGAGGATAGTDAGPTAPEEIAGVWPAPGGKPGRTFRMRGVSGGGPSPPFGRVWTNGDLNTETNLLGPGGRLYGYDSSAGNGAITAVDAASGARQWATDADDGSGDVGPPLWAGTDALVCSLGALDPSDGSRRWGRVDTDEFRGRVAGPTGVYGVVPGEEAPPSLRKLDGATGDEVWTRLPAGVERASPWFVANGRLYARAATGDGVATLALEAETGRRSFLDTRGEPLAAGPQYRFLHDGGTVTAVARGSGDAVWSLDVNRDRIAVDRDRVYHVTTSGATLVAREKGSGSAVWRAALEPHDPGSLFVAGGRVYVGGAAGTGATETRTASGTRTVVSQAFTRGGETAWTVEGFVAAFVTEKMVFGVVPRSPKSVAMAGFASV